MKEPQVTVGIMSERQIRFVFNGTYLANGVPVSGEHEAHTDGKQIFWNGNRYTRIVFTPEKEDYSFCLKEVTIGVKFHWERKEDQTFKGNLNLIVENGLITAINALSVEDYLLSVISSEMSATASLELLKSHAVISRSWLLAQIRKNKELAGKKPDSLIRTDKELIHWYDREDHINFDVCADDHCQRYQGITRACTEVVAQAIQATHGEVLTYDDEICDARFSKCCGGVVEEFSSCWENINPPYLTALRDDKNEKDFPDLKNEDTARQWIYTSPTAFCNTTDKKILSQVLNNYDQETTDFYRWSVVYSQSELAHLIHEKSGIDFGEIIDLKPIERGTSGRLVRLQIQANPYYRERAGNSPCTISVPFIQLGLRRRARRYTERNTPTVRHTRSRLGTWRRTLPDRSRRHGRTRLSLSRNTATLFRRCEHRKTILKYTP